MTIYLLLYAHEPGMGAEMGGVRKVLELTRELKKNGHHALVFAPAFLSVPDDPEVSVVSYKTLDGPLLRPLSAYAMMVIVPFLRSFRERPHVIYARTDRSVLPGLLARLLGARFLFEVNADAYAEQRGRVSWLRSLTTLAAEWLNCRLAHTVIAITPGLRTMMERRYKIDPAKVALIPSGTDPARFSPKDPADCRRRLGLQEDGFLIAFLGVLYEHQGVSTLIEALPEVRRTLPSTRLAVVGDGPARAALEALAGRLGLDSAISFVGAVPYEKVPDYLSAADLCVAPFRASRGETSPLKLFDYLASGRAVVASEIPAIRELVKESGAIVPVPPDSPHHLAEAIIGLLKDPAKRRLMGESGRRFIESGYGWNQVARAVALLGQAKKR